MGLAEAVIEKLPHRAVGDANPEPKVAVNPVANPPSGNVPATKVATNRAGRKRRIVMFTQADHDFAKKVREQRWVVCTHLV